MVCASCNVAFDGVKVDAFVYGDEAWCSEVCAKDAGWIGDAWGEMTIAVVNALHEVASEARVDCEFDEGERRTLDAGLAILRFESGAERQAGPPFSVALLRETLSDPDRYRSVAFSPSSVAQMSMALSVLLGALKP